MLFWVRVVFAFFYVVLVYCFVSTVFLGVFGCFSVIGAVCGFFCEFAFFRVYCLVFWRFHHRIHDFAIFWGRLTCLVLPSLRNLACRGRSGGVAGMFRCYCS